MKAGWSERSRSDNPRRDIRLIKDGAGSRTDGQRVGARVERVKKLFALVIIVALVALGLPMAMGGVSECPMCTSPDLRTTLGMCAAVFLSLILLMLFSAFKVAVNRTELYGQLTGGSIFRPPRSA